jgi:predicted DNA-binding transcriptional regulator YafY
MSESILDKVSRAERLRELVVRINKGEKVSAFDLAVQYDKSINVIYRDVQELKELGAIPNDFEFTKKERPVG